MKSLQEFITEAENSNDVYVVYFGDKTMENFYYTEEEAKSAVDSLNKEVASNNAFYKKEPRKNIEKYYDTKDIGKFPTRLAPISYSPNLTDMNLAITYNEIFDILIKLELTIYTPTRFILPSKASKYSDIYDKNVPNKSFNQENREKGMNNYEDTCSGQFRPGGIGCCPNGRCPARGIYSEL